MSFQVFSVHSQTEGRWKAVYIDLSSKLSFTCGGNIKYNKSVYHPISTFGTKEYPGNFQNKLISYPFN